MNSVGTYVSQWGEGPIWYQDKLIYIDIEGQKVLTFDPARHEEQVWDVGERVGTVVPRASGGLVIAGASGFRFLDTKTGEIEPWIDPESGLPGTRFNDGKCDPKGRFWAGSMDLGKPRQPIGALYRLDTDHSVDKLFDEVSVSNGIVWNKAADTMYYIDTPRAKVEAFDYDNDSGAITNRRTVIDTTGMTGVPDGMAMDDDEKLWVAMCHGGQVQCFDPRAQTPENPVHVLRLPVMEPTAVAFGGPDLEDLYITTGLPSDDAGREDGLLFCAQIDGVRGRPATPFAG